MKVKTFCSWCGAEIYRNPSQLAVSKHSFCSKECTRNFRSKATNPEGYTKHEHLSKYNKEHNASRMTADVKAKLFLARFGSGEGKSYPKINGRHAHRVVAEKILGRKLRPGEVVHHKDGNKQNFSPENLEVLPGQSEHAKLHGSMRRKEVMPHDV